MIMNDEDVSAEAIQYLLKQYDDYIEYCTLTNNKVIPITDYLLCVYHDGVYKETWKKESMR